MSSRANLITSRFQPDRKTQSARLPRLHVKTSRSREVKSWLMSLLTCVWRCVVSVGRASLWSVCLLRLLCRWLSCRRRKLLVLDLDGTLMKTEEVAARGEHTFYLGNSWVRIVPRPYLSEFLTFAKANFDLAVFTAAQSDYAQWAMQELGLEAPLYARNHCTHLRAASPRPLLPLNLGTTYVKDLRKVDGDMSRVVILDDLEESYQFQKSNGVAIKTWRGGVDGELQRCEDVLRRVSSCSDVRDVVKW